MVSETLLNQEYWRVSRVPLSVHSIGLDLPCAAAFEMLVPSPEIPGLAIVDQDGIHGLIDRQSLLLQFSRPMMRDLYGGRPVERIMDRNPLIVDSDTTLDELAEQISTDRSGALAIGFIVTKHGRFAGVGSALDVIRLAAAESRHRAREIDAARRKAELAQRGLIQAEKLASLGALVAGVAHEINTPVGIGLTAASTLRDLTQGIRNKVTEGVLRKAELSAFLDMAEETSHLLVTHMQRAAELVQSFKQIAVDRASAERRQFYLHRYLEEVLVSLHPVLKKTGLMTSLDCPADLLIDSYPGAFSQVIVNFVMNSVVHAYDDPVAGHISLEVRRLDAAMIEVTYRDDGKGIAADILPQIFDPFFTTRRGQGGSGLGLHIVYNLITNTLGGSIDVSSSPGQGARFTVSLPIRAPLAGSAE